MAMSLSLRLSAALFALVLITAPVRADKDLLDDVKKRLAIEAERVEKEFAAERAAAYKLVRSDNPKLAEATEKLEGLLAMVRNDNALASKRREVLLVTLKWDLDKVKEIAGESRRTNIPRAIANSGGGIREDIRRDDEKRRADNRRVSDDARSIIDSRSRTLEELGTGRLAKRDAYNRTMPRSMSRPFRNRGP